MRRARTDDVGAAGSGRHARATTIGDMLDFGLDLNVWPWVWLGVAVLFAVIELTILGGSLVLLPFAISALVASVLAFYDAPSLVQWGVFGGLGAILFALVVRWQSLLRSSNVLPPGVGAMRLVGMPATVIAAIDPADPARGGRVAVEGEIWAAIAPEGPALPEGSRVRITRVEGTRVLVEPLGAPSEPPDGGPNQPPVVPPAPPSGSRNTPPGSPTSGVG